ncbi:hypothetical protein [Bizionia myxarmorum]|uniref:DUF4168 domain-containing protein n=1 Tax=Bizionia myxarmorum TaxID=291186 RepID=A0A5D0R4H9_9FLAO|nr:hypothetical protein [Bizionia myxarmorum]TYB75776.1 hypothetical protein ES674_13190 [Bizionia myxarmorum]
MKKLLLIIVLTFVGMQVSAQQTTDSNSKLEKIASEQVALFHKKLNLNEKQQELATSLILEHLKTEKTQKLIGTSKSKSASLESDSKIMELINRALLDEPIFDKEFTEILDENQEQILNKMIPRV